MLEKTSRQACHMTDVLTVAVKADVVKLCLHIKWFTAHSTIVCQPRGVDEPPQFLENRLKSCISRIDTIDATSPDEISLTPFGRPFGRGRVPVLIG